MGRYKIEDGVTQSMLRDFFACRRRVALQLEGWQTRTPRSTPRFGSMTHHVLSKMYEAMRAGTEHEDLSIIVNAETAKYVHKEVTKASTAKVAQEIEGTGILVSMILQEYLAYWHADDVKKKWAELERVFDTPFGGFRLRGRWDGGYEIKPRKREEVWLLETKTKSKVSEDSLEVSLSMDFQSQFYLIAAGLILPKPERLKGVLYNIIRNPNLYRRKGENDEQYAERVREDIHKRPDFYFKRFELTFDKKQLELFAVELMMKLEEFAAFVKGDLPTYRREDSCDVFWKCEFLEMCVSMGQTVGYKKGRVLFEELIDLEEVSNGGKKGRSKKTGKKTGRAKRKKIAPKA